MEPEEFKKNLLKKINSINYDKLVQIIAIISENHIAI
jgi:hypothetical protein